MTVYDGKFTSVAVTETLSVRPQQLGWRQLGWKIGVSNLVIIEGMLERCSGSACCLCSSIRVFRSGWDGRERCDDRSGCLREQHKLFTILN